jgi:2-polyprenyl-3-methyl-5-hydroxy-6-metoxy-1,4-benzoquinol methylase
MNARKLLDGKRRLVLDYGCGNGVGSVILKRNGWEIVGIDSDREAIAFADEAWGHLISFEIGDWTGEDRVSPLSYDAVVCLEVIEHVSHPGNLLASLKKALRPDGVLILSTLNHNSQYRKNRGHIGKYTLENFEEMVEKVFPGVRIYDYTMENELEPGSSITPMVAVWRGK